MVKKHKSRVVKARRWIVAGAVATAVASSAGTGDAGSLPGDKQELTSTPHDEILLAASEGEGKREASASSEGESEGRVSEGEGEGEGEMASAAPAEIQLLTDLGFMQGHAYAGLKLYQAGEIKLGQVHIGHPLVEKYDAVAKPLEKRGFANLKAQLVAMSEAAEAGKPAEEVGALYDEVVATLEDIRADLPPAKQLKSLALLTRIAADEYNAAFKDGKLINQKEYQDAWGFLQVVKTEAKELTESSDKAVAEAANEILEQAEKAEAVFGDLMGSGIEKPDASAIYGAAARMEISANGVS